MKAIWQGSLSFGLVNMPVALYSAVEAQTFGFTMLCGTCKSPISYMRWCEHCNKEVSWENIVKGIKLKDGSYFILTKEHLQKLKPIKTDTISIVEFVDPTLIELIYFEKHYYIAPKKNSERAYFLFIAALNKGAKVAVGSFVMKDKDHVCVISPYKNALLLTTLNYDYEIKSLDHIATLKPVPKISQDELKLAIQVINQRSKKKFDISNFKDTFAARLSEVIKKNKGKRKLIEKPKKLTVNKDLMAALRASLERKQPSVTRRTAIRAAAKR